MKQYITAKNPNDGKWYALGYIGKNQYIPISDPCNSKKQALKEAKHLEIAENAAKKDLLNLNLKDKSYPYQ